MLYYGSFRSLLDDREYYVQIITNNSTAQSAEIRLGPNAFSVKMDAGSSIYETLHATTASVDIVSDGTSFDMFSSTPKQNKVRLFEVHRDASNNPSYRLCWSGYTQPCTYNTPFSRPTDTWTLECVDEIGVLQYMDYEADGVTETEMSDGTIRKNYIKRNASFADVIETLAGDILESSHPLLHYPHANYLDRVLVSECNFFNEDDEAMKCSEVLSELCKHMGCYAYINYDTTFESTINAAEDNFHMSFVDVDFIPAAQNTANVQKYTLTKGDIIGGNATLSLDPVYNKVVVRDSMYTVDNLMPSMWEEEDLVNIMSYPWTDGLDDKHDAMFGGYTSRHYCIDDSHDLTTDKYGYWQWYGKYYLNRKFQDISGYPSTIADSSTYRDTMADFGKESDFTYPSYFTNHKGAFFGKMDVEWIGAKKGDSAWEKRTFYLNKHKYEFTNYLCLNMLDDSSTNEVMISFQDAEVDKKPFFTKTDAYLIFTGSIQVDDRENILFPLCDYGEKNDKASFWDIYLYAELKISMGIPGHEINYYWSNSNGWVTTPTKFQMRFYDDRESVDHSVHINGKTYDIKNNVTPDMGIDKNGYVIPMPKPSSGSQFVPSVPQLTIYGRGRIDSDYRIDRIWLKDFDMEVFQPKIGGAEEEDSDTEYTFYIDTNNVQDFDDVEFKICTWDGKNVNYSVPVLANQSYNEYNPITTVFTDDGFAYNAEELYAYKVVNQYMTPTKRESLTLRGTNLLTALVNKPLYVHDPVLGIDCIIDKYTINYANDSIEADIVEKKIISSYN